jgi:hypothetical protein
VQIPLLILLFAVFATSFVSSHIRMRPCEPKERFLVVASALYTGASAAGCGALEARWSALGFLNIV